MYLSKYNIIFDNNSEEYPEHKVLVNFLNRKIHLIPYQLADIVKTNNLNEIGSFNQFLIENNYLYNSAVEEQQAERAANDYYYEKLKEEGHQFFISPTYSCNLNCTYCYQDKVAMPRESEYMTYEMVDRITQIIQDKVTVEKAHTGPPVVTLFGGEPLMATKKGKSIVRYILNKCRMAGLPIGVVTNGTQLDQFIDDFKGLNVVTFQITLDGPKRIHDQRRFSRQGEGTYDKTIAAIELCVEHGMPVMLKTVIDEQNIDHLPELAEFLDKKGWLDLEDEKFMIQLAEDISGFILHCMDLTENQGYSGKVSGADKNVKILKRVSEMAKSNASLMKMLRPESLGVSQLFYRGELPPPKLSTCSASHISWTFAPDGTIFACPGGVAEHLVLGRYYPEFEINEERLGLWHSRAVDNNPECEDCAYKYICGGSCASLAHGFDIIYCRPIHDIVQVGLDVYLPRIIDRIRENGML